MRVVAYRSSRDDETRVASERLLVYAAAAHAQLKPHPKLSSPVLRTLGRVASPLSKRYVTLGRRVSVTFARCTVGYSAAVLAASHRSHISLFFKLFLFAEKG